MRDDHSIWYSSAGIETPRQWVWEAARVQGCWLRVLDTWLLTPRLVDSTLLGSAVAPGAAGEAVVLLVLLWWRWGSLRILYSRICGSQYVSLCHSVRWVRVPHLNNNLNKDSFKILHTALCDESSAVTAPLLLSPQLSTRHTSRNKNFYVNTFITSLLFRE